MDRPIPLFLSSDPDTFATGASRYWDSFPGMRETKPRIYVRFRPHGTNLPFLALFDTGGHFCILNQEVFLLIRNNLTDRLDDFTLQTAHGRIHGDLYLHTVELIAEEGENLEINATLFVSPEWQGPCFLGYTGVLDHLCHALDPNRSHVYFGPLR